MPKRTLDCNFKLFKNFTELLADPLSAPESFHMLHLRQIEARYYEDVSVIKVVCLINNML
jgi:hypothetical protein